MAQPKIVKVSTDDERADRWRLASDRDPRLYLLPEGKRFSALVRLELDAAANRILGQAAG